MSTGYVNPLVAAHVTPERIDMGVDYAGTGTYVAIGDAVVTQVNMGGWGKFGNWIEYQLTSGPQKGKFIYYAEGVTPVAGLHVGQKLTAGQAVANLVPGWQYGTEIGYGSGAPNTAYAGSYYHEGQRTAAGQAFSDFIASLGGKPGLAEGRAVVGGAPAGAGAVAGGGSLPGIGAQLAGTRGGGSGGLSLPSIPDLNPVDAINNAINGLFNSIVSHARYAALAFVAIIGGFILMARGTKTATHAEGTPE